MIKRLAIKRVGIITNTTSPVRLIIDLQKRHSTLTENLSTINKPQ
jgi:hypothetical protein